MIERRHARQAKLREVGAEGQARIQALVVRIDDPGLAGEIAARYLAGAGVGTLVVATDRQAEAARSVDARVRVSTFTTQSFARQSESLQAHDCPAEEDLGGGSSTIFSAGQSWSLQDLDPAAREVARGAHFALRALR